MPENRERMGARLELDSMELMRFANDDVTRRDPAAAIARDFPIAVCDHEGAIVPRMIVKLIIAVGAKNVMHQASRPIILAREVPFLQIWAALIMGENRSEEHTSELPSLMRTSYA